MNRRLLLACAIAVVSAVIHADSRPIPKAPQSPTMDGATPLGVYQGAGCDGVNRLQEFERWFGRKRDLVLDVSSWKSLQSASVWAAKCWSDAGQKNVVYSLPMLPEDNSATLADGAAGRFDELFRK